MPQLRTLLNVLSEEVLNLDEAARAKYKDGDEVTRKDGRIFKKVSGKWVYQRKAKGGSPGEEKPPAPPTGQGEAPPAPPKFKRAKKPAMDAEETKVDGPFKKLAGRARRVSMSALLDAMTLEGGMTRDEAGKVLKAQIEAGNYRFEIDKKTREATIIRSTPAERERFKSEKDAKDAEKRDAEEKERQEKEKRDAEEKERQEKETSKKATVEKFHKIAGDTFSKLAGDKKKVPSVDFRKTMMEETGMDLESYLQEHAKLIAPDGPFMELWQKSGGKDVYHLIRRPPKVAPKEAPKTPPAPPAPPKPEPPKAPPQTPPGPVPGPQPPPKPELKKDPVPPPTPPPPKPEPPKAPPEKKDGQEKPHDTGKSWEAKREEIRKKNPVPTFKNGKEAESWAKAKYPHATWEMGKLHPEMAHQSVQRFHHLAQDWPEVVQKISYFGDRAAGTHEVRKYNRRTGQIETKRSSRRFGQGTFAHASSDGRLCMNPAYFKDPEGFKRSVQRSVEDKFLQKGTAKDGPAAGIISHEFGHHVDYALSAATDHYMFPGVMLSTSAIHTLFKRQVRATNDLSMYALTNDKEGWAEGFSSREHMDTGEWSDYTRRQHEWINEYQARRGQAKSGKDAAAAAQAMSPEEKKKAADDFRAFLNKTGLKIAGWN